MSEAIEHLKSAMQQAMSIRPKVGGFPYLAETLRRVGVKRNIWSLPVMMQGAPLTAGASDIAPFDEDALVSALRTDQAGRSAFPEFLVSAWKVRVVGYEVDFTARTCTYFGAGHGRYVESYPAAEIK